MDYRISHDYTASIVLKFAELTINIKILSFIYPAGAATPPAVCCTHSNQVSIPFF